MVGQAEWNLHVRRSAVFSWSARIGRATLARYGRVTEDAGLGWKLTTMSRCTPEDSGTLD
jgi:hypothetical protein